MAQAKSDATVRANEKRLIDANRAKRRIIAFATGCCSEVLTVDSIIMLLERQDTVDAVEVVHGRWEPHPRASGFDRCSVCNDCIIYGDWAGEKKWNYCPNCGAKMDGDQDV